MKYRKLDADGDYIFGGSLNDFHHDTPEGVGQAVLTRLKLWSGEWFIDTQDGTPYLTGVIGKYTKDTYDQLMQMRILGTQGVTQITAYSSNLNADTRHLTIQASIDTIYGQTTITTAQ